MTIKLTDAVTPERVRKTADGFLIADVAVARTGVQVYLGSEVGKPEMDRVRMYRPPEVVFSDKAMAGIAHRPLTDDHPAEDVTAANWKTLATGHTGGEVMRDGQTVRVPIMLMDAAAIANYDSGRKRQLSLGYTGSVEFKDGISPEGEPFDCVLTDYSINHLAQVSRARGGEQLRIGDGVMTDPLPTAVPTPTGGPQMADVLKMVVHDGLSVSTTEQGAQVIGVLQTRLADATSALQGLKDGHSAAIAAKDKELADRDTQIAELKKTQISDAAIDKLVAERADLLNKAKRIHDADYTGKSPAEIRKAVVTAKIGDAAIADKSDAYIEARFDTLLESANTTDPVRQMYQGRDSAPPPSADHGQTEYETKLQDAWRGDQAKK